MLVWLIVLAAVGITLALVEMEPRIKTLIVVLMIVLTLIIVLNFLGITSIGKGLRLPW